MDARQYCPLGTCDCCDAIRHAEQAARCPNRPPDDAWALILVAAGLVVVGALLVWAVLP